MPLLRQADADDMIDPGVMSLDELEDRLRMDRAEIESEARLEYDYVRDATVSMSWLLENSEGPAEDDEPWIGADLDALDEDLERPPQLPYLRPVAKIGRNDPRPCGSGKKCHLAVDPFARG